VNYEIAFIIAVATNCIVDYFVYRQIREMRVEYRHIKTETVEISGNLRSIGTNLPDLLQEHAKVGAKALGSQIGYYQGKAAKAQEGQLDGLNKTVEALGPFAELLKGGVSGPEGPKGGFHL